MSNDAKITALPPLLPKHGRTTKLITKQQRKVAKETAQPDIAALLAGAIDIFAHEIEFYNIKSKGGMQLTPHEAKKVVSYVEALAKLNKEHREQAKEMDMSKMSAKDLVRILAKTDNSLQDLSIEELKKLTNGLEDDDNEEE